MGRTLDQARPRIHTESADPPSPPWHTAGMRARDLSRTVPVVRPEDHADAALRLLASSGLPGLVVAEHGSFIVIPASQVMRVVLPRYVLDDPALGRVWDEVSADDLAARLAGKHVSDLITSLDLDDERPSHMVDGDATVVEIAAVMAAAHVPLVAVVDRGKLLGVVTVNRLIQHLTP